MALAWSKMLCAWVIRVVASLLATASLTAFFKLRRQAGQAGELGVLQVGLGDGELGGVGIGAVARIGGDGGGQHLGLVAEAGIGGGVLAARRSAAWVLSSAAPAFWIWLRK